MKDYQSAILACLQDGIVRDRASIHWRVVWKPRQSCSLLGRVLLSLMAPANEAVVRVDVCLDELVRSGVLMKFRSLDGMPPRDEYQIRAWALEMMSTKTCEIIPISSRQRIRPHT